MNRVLLVIAMASLLSACAHAPVNSCDGLVPLRPRASTVDYVYLNDPAFGDAVRLYNMQGAARCGWKARP